MQLTHEHEELFNTTKNFVEKEINPHVDAWEQAGAFPAHEVFKKAGRLGLLGVNKPEAYGGLGLDYSYQMVVIEEMGTCHSGAVPMACSAARWRLCRRDVGMFASAPSRKPTGNSRRVWICRRPDRTS